VLLLGWPRQETRRDHSIREPALLVLQPAAVAGGSYAEPMPLASPFTDNLQGWGTVAGAAIAAVALYFAFRAYRSQSQQLADQQAINEQQSVVLGLQGGRVAGVHRGPSADGC
jgi:hypothetical protein